MKDFLTRFMATNRSLPDGDELFRHDFEATISFVGAALGPKAFRPERTLNAAVFDAVMVGVNARLASGEIRDQAGFAAAYAELGQDADFASATTTGTSQQANVRRRIESAIQAFSSIE